MHNAFDSVGLVWLHNVTGIVTFKTFNWITHGHSIYWLLLEPKHLHWQARKNLILKTGHHHWKANHVNTRNFKIKVKIQVSFWSQDACWRPRKKNEKNTKSTGYVILGPYIKKAFSVAVILAVKFSLAEVTVKVKDQTIAP